MTEERFMVVCSDEDEWTAKAAIDRGFYDRDGVRPSLRVVEKGRAVIAFSRDAREIRFGNG